ncbi:transcription initiation factor TFIID subunit 2-like, partial [Clytia hemisphaerica]|uniref:transcription initiation factor TFIID subunit 2-like n=1 Tax=Clytia hemisphaerica TaxID=252671 RepID=UPI0034D6E66C
FSDGGYLSALIEALGNTIGPADNRITETTVKSSLPLNEEARAVLSEVNRRLNMEKILSSFKYSVTCSCLKAIRRLQVTGHIPAESAFFRKYSQYGLFEDIRLTALEILVDFVHVNSSEKDLDWLLDLVEKDPVPRIRHHIVMCLTKSPPFEKKKSVDSVFNNLTLVERLWQLMNSDCTLEYRLRCSIMELYSTLWGRITPPCVPSHGFGVVIDLKEKKALSNITAPKAPASPEMGASVSAGEEGTLAKKRRLSVEHFDDQMMDSFPGTPMSMCSEGSATNKIKLKIKLAGEETSHDSGSDFLPPVKTNDPLGLSLLDDNESNSSKKVKEEEEKETQTQR